MNDLEKKAQEEATKKRPYNLREKKRKEGRLPFLDTPGTGRRAV